MRINMFIKTFLILFVSFSAVFFLSGWITLERFPDLYIEENVSAIKESILESSNRIQNGTELTDTTLSDLSSETSFIRYQNFTIVESIGPDYLQEEDLLEFVIGVYDNPDKVVEGPLTYYTYLVDDVYRIDYIYEFAFGDYLIISTRFQSLTNIDRVLANINLYESIAQVIVITLLSAIISFNISHPLKKINRYAKDISDLKFDTSLRLNRNDEFRDLVSSLNEMTFNLKTTYDHLNQANATLNERIDYEQEQEKKKQHFIMTINHELKTPLSVMRGMIEGMLDNVGRYQDKDKYLAELLHQIEAIEHITSDFTYRLRLEDKIVKGETASTEVIRRSIDDLTELRSRQSVRIQIHLDSADLRINEELLGILVTNLVKNAIKYTTGSSVEVRGVTSGSFYTFVVRNKGTIAQEDLDQIFQSFYRADHDKQDESGTGLGLFIVQEICQMYHYEYKLFNDNGYVVAKVKIPIKTD